MKLRFSEHLNAIGFSETKLIQEIFNQSSMRKSLFLNLGQSPGRYQVSNWEQRRDNTHTIRPRSGRIVYKNYCLGTWQIFFRNHFEKSVSFGARVCPPLGAGENFSWEARRLTSFSDVFKIVDLLSLYWFWIDFHFKLWWIPRYFLKKPLRKFSFGKITS